MSTPDEVMQMRRLREGARDGKLHVALMWNDITDLALHVTAPSGETICWTNMRSHCGGWQDVDMNVRGESTEPVENIHWDSPPYGKYVVSVLNYRVHTRQGNRLFSSPNRCVQFRVELSRDGYPSETYTGSVKHKERQIAMTFVHGDRSIVVKGGPKLTGTLKPTRGSVSTTHKVSMAAKARRTRTKTDTKPRRKPATKSKAKAEAFGISSSKKARKYKKRVKLDWSSPLSTPAVPKWLYAAPSGKGSGRLSALRSISTKKSIKPLSRAEAWMEPLSTPTTPKWLYAAPLGKGSDRLSALRSKLMGTQKNATKISVKKTPAVKEKLKRIDDLTDSMEMDLSVEPSLSTPTKASPFSDKIFSSDIKTPDFGIFGGTIPKTPRLALKEMKREFKKLSQDHDRISRSGFKRAINEFGRPKADRLNSVFMALDKDGSGEIDFEEFANGRRLFTDLVGM